MAGLRLLSSVCLLHLLSIVSCGYHTGEGCALNGGGVGVCKPMLQCKSAQEDLKRGIRPTRCSFQGWDPIVCCSQQGAAPTTPRINSNPVRIPSTTSIPTASTSTPGERATNKCYEYSQACGSSLVGGTKVHPKEFPHMAALGFGPRNNILWGCGGSLISDKFILTAAHCLYQAKIGPVSWVLLASEVTRTFAEDVPANARKGQTHRVVRSIRHPEYRPPAKYNDIALLEIGPALEENALDLDSKELHPACLPVGNELDDPIMVATGWGRVGYGEDASPDLLKVELNLLDSAICNETYKAEMSTKKLPRGIVGSMLCAGVLEGGKDTCKGDSGGPLQTPFKEACMYEIWGITSFGQICGLANSPAVYTRVSQYIPWIESIVWP